MKSLRNNLVVGIILSLMLSSTAFASPSITLISGHMRVTLALVNTFNKSVEDGDALLARIEDAVYGKNVALYQELWALSNGLNQRFKDNSATLVKLQVLRDSDCTQSFADASKSAESRNAFDACSELRDALGAATDSRGATAQGLDAINNAMSRYVSVLEAEAARVAEAARIAEAARAAEAARVAEELKAKQEAEAKAQLEAERVAAELKLKQEAEAAAELKAKQDADAAAAKAAAAKVAAAKAAAAKVAALKKTTITCVKGKLTKKVTAVKPVCPAGYKKK
jgi:hypothetical protein